MYPPWKASYERVHGTDSSDPQSDDELSLRPKERCGKWRNGFHRERRLTYVLSCFLGIGMLIGAFGLGYTIGQIKSAPEAHQKSHVDQHQHQHEHQSEHGHYQPADGHSGHSAHINANGSDNGTSPIKRVCGNTEAEAIALGCRFDLMTWAWLSSSCPRYASDEFITADSEPWRYYMDVQGFLEVRGDNWTSALNNQVPIYVERREHITHCLYTFLSMAQAIRDGTQTFPRLSGYGHIRHCVMIVLDSAKFDPAWKNIDTDIGIASYDEGC
ncbi:hypothetical protein M431DRAFT_534679 [Trichoderma harzianum CBS 226.95]|uniref:Uncharacterized protein n=1 Tax=Trichoderma harzianum CBS 226.95 TaxID=983964 RepID=A0A2T3ZXK5_TRIHA|nr:hypothetical protein M431DRAFT_534679 [Trichoderma harzianum CBS 226.95]PTB49542.1 hypothetical protein M431DRAFT_534679 [Trichoderma harzianum CBS 226.95]